MINVALPKGRLGEKVYAMFEQAGYECPSIKETNRKLIFENPEKQIRYFWVKPSDVSIYVARGAADIGVAGGDGVGVIFRHGVPMERVKMDEIVPTLIKEICNMKENKND